MSVTRYQALTQNFSVPPLAPAFKEGFEATGTRPRAVKFVRGRDAEVFAPPAAAAQAPSGWQADRAAVRVGRTTTDREQPAHDLLVGPPLAPPFKEGWQADRSVPPKPGRALTRDEQSSMTLLSVPPLAPAFKEGWQADRYKPRRSAATIVHDEQSSGTILGGPPLAPAFKEGWQSDRAFVRARRVPVAAYALDFQPAPAAPLSFPEGWQSERAVIARTQRPRVDAATAFLSVPPLAPAFKEGWAAASRLAWVTAARRRPDEQPALAPAAAVAAGWFEQPRRAVAPSWRPKISSVEAEPLAPLRPAVLLAEASRALLWHTSAAFKRETELPAQPPAAAAAWGWDASRAAPALRHVRRLLGDFLDFAPGVVAAGLIQRRTLGPLGARTGSRKTTGHGQGGL